MNHIDKVSVVGFPKEKYDKNTLDSWDNTKKALEALSNDEIIIYDMDEYFTKLNNDEEPNNKAYWWHAVEACT